MKKIFLSAAVVMMAIGAASAQDSHRGHKHAEAKSQAAQPATAVAAPLVAVDGTAAMPATSLTTDNIAFVEERHDFGTLREGDAAEYVFKVKNTGKEDLIISKVQPSCGCTTPDWTKEPIKPGKMGMVKASYGTQGRPGHFDKNLTVMTNAGNKMIYISGNVEKAPETSAPQNSSMIRTN